MGGLMARNKGKRGEREVINELLQPIVDRVCASADVERFDIQRNTLQSDKGGCDLHGLDWCAIEVKRVEANGIEKWWIQTVRQARNGQVPILLHRRNRQPWRCRMMISTAVGSWTKYMVVDISVADFLEWFEVSLLQRLVREKV